MMKFKDIKGHTVYLDTDGDAIRLKCPYCEMDRIFRKEASEDG